MRKSWGNIVATNAYYVGISRAKYPQVHVLKFEAVGKIGVLHIFNLWVLQAFTHNKNGSFQSVIRALFHTIHSTYNKPLLIKSI